MTDNLGTIGFGFDSSELEKGQRALAALSAEATKSASALDRTQQSADRIRQSAATTAAGVERQAQAMKASAQATATAGAAQTQAAQSAGNAMQGLGDRAKAAADKMVENAKRIGDSGRHFAGIQQAVAQLAATMGLGGNTGLAGTMSNLANTAGGLVGALGPLARIAATGAGAIALIAASSVAAQVQLAKVQDRFTLYEARVKLVTGSTLDARNAIDQLTASSLKNGIALDTSLDTFTRFIRLRNELGASNRDVVAFTQTVQQIGITSGATPQETAAGMQQLAQALASGKLSGDELRSILENMPVLAKLLADGLGVSVGQLRAMGAEGKLTSDRVFGAILAAQDKVAREFEKMPKTAERSFQAVSDQATLLARSLAERFKSSEFVRGLAEGLQGALKAATDAVKPPSLDDQLKAIDSELSELTTRASERSAGRVVQTAQDRALALAQGPRIPRPGSAGTNQAENRDLAEQNRLLEQRKGILDQIGAQQREQAEGRIAKANADAVLPVTQAIERAKALNDIERKREEILQNITKIENGLANARAPEMAALLDQDSRTRFIKTQETALTALRAELSATGTEYEKLARKVSDSGRDVQRTSLGQSLNQSQLDLITKARELSEASARDFRPISQGQALNALLDEQSIKIRAASNEYRTQIEVINLQAQAIGKTREEVLLLEGDAKAIEQISKLVFTGNAAQDRKLLDAITALVNGMTMLKRAEDELANRRQAQENQDHYNREAAGLANLEKGAYAAARAMAEIDAAIAERQRKGAGALGLQKFEFEEQAKQARALFEDREKLKPLDIQISTVGNARERILRERQAEIDKLIRDSGPDEEAGGGALTARIEAKYEEFRRKDKLAAAEARADVLEQIEYTDKLLRLQGLNTEQYQIQVALLDKQRDLKRAGFDLESPEAAQILADTQSLARRNARLEEQKHLAEQYRGIWQNAANGIQQALAQTFEELLNTGRFNAQTLDKMLSATINKIVAQMASALIFEPLVKSAQRALGLDVIPVGGGSPGSSRGGGGGGSILSGVGGVLQSLFSGNFADLFGTSFAAQNGLLASTYTADALTQFGLAGFAKGGGVIGGKPIVTGELGTEVFLPSGFGGFRGRGGGASANTPIMVGERGPEVFVPPTSGQIIPNHQLRDYGMDRWVAGKRAAGGMVVGGLPYAVGEQGTEGFVSGQTSTGRRAGQPVVVNFNVNTPDAGGFRASQAQIMADLSRAVSRGTIRNS